jgi:mannose-1-phosphate guanylyltransferase
MEHFYPVIIAGGKGTRLWPVSRANDPKQVKPFEDDKSLLQKTFARVAELAGPDKVWIETAAQYEGLIREQLTQLAENNFIAEPAQRNTAPAVGIAAAVLHKLDPESVMLQAWSDHWFKDVEEYLAKVRQAYELLKEYPDYLIDIVAKPEYPATGFGYLEVKEPAKNSQNVEAFFVKRFVEKPDLTTAEKYLEAGTFYWNPAIFLWKTQTILDLFKEHKPEMYGKLMEIAESFGTPEWQTKLNEIYPTLENISIDYAILEKTDRIIMLPAEMGWKDVGAWQAVYEILQSGTDEAVARGKKVIAVDSKDTLIYGGNDHRLIGVVGVEDLVIVDTDDALLVMRKSKDQDIKQLVEKIREQGLEDYL